MRTPITALRGFTQILLRHLDRGAAVEVARLHAGLAAIDQQSERLARLVAQLLDVARLDAGRLTLHRTETDVVALVEGEVQVVRQTTDRHTIAVAAPPSLLACLDACASSR